jgi:hypothetical protein
VKVDQKYLERLEMCCWRRMEKISWTDRVRNEEMESRRRRISYKKEKESKLIALVTGFADTALQNTLLKERERDG